jgi:hypothetical protein
VLFTKLAEFPGDYSFKHPHQLVVSDLAVETHVASAGCIKARR